MVFFRSYFHVFGLLLVFVVCVFSFPSKAQYTEASYIFPELNLKNIADIEIPDDFTIPENFAWGAGALFGYPNVKTIIPVSVYNLADVCDIDFLKVDIGGLFFHIERSDGNLRGTAVWKKSLKETCFAINESGEFPDGISWNVGDITQKWEIAATKITKDLAVENSGDFVILLSGIKAKPVREYWLSCNTKQKPSPYSICYYTLKASPYKKHRKLTVL